jgi:hypothetical protein
VAVHFRTGIGRGALEGALPVVVPCRAQDGEFQAFSVANAAQNI